MTAPGADAELRRLERVADWLDARFWIPGTNIRIGFDPIIGLIPGIGDSATLIVSAWLIARAVRLGAPPGLAARMALNVAADWLIGMIPVLGDLFDVSWKANRRNVALLRNHLRRTRAADI